MQYGLRIIFETQLSHKTNRGQITAVTRQITDGKDWGAEVRRF
jgi:hypothetical protein